MKKHRNRVIRLLGFISSSQLKVIFLILFLCIIFQVLIISNIQEYKKKNDISAAKIYGESIASGILLSLNHSIETSKILKNIYIQYGDQVCENFDQLCTLFSHDNSLGSLYIAPEGIIEVAYPESVNAATIGFNMLKDPVQGPRAQLAIDTKQITVAGPHRLVEDGVGFIIRNPIFEDNEFKAFAVVVLDWHEFVIKALNQVDHINSGYRFAVWKEDNSDTVTDEYGFIFKDCYGDISRLVDIPIEVPNDVWHLSIEPVGGWSKSANVIPESIISSVMICIIMVLLILKMASSAKQVYKAEHDELTGLLLRNAFCNYVDKLLRNNPNKVYTVIMADIENFKQLNALYGTKKCDQVLKYLADTYSSLENCIYVSRYGSNSFASICENEFVNDYAVFEENCKKIKDNSPIKNFKVNYGEYKSVDHKLPANVICDRALLAAKSIKHNFEKNIANFEGPVSSKLYKTNMLEASFEDAIKNEEFKVWFQPKFDAKSEMVIGAEALVRWVRQDGTMVPPAEFIDVFEKDGLIVRLDEYVFRKVCIYIKAWQDAGMEAVPVSINLSRVSLLHEGTIERYKQIVDEIGILSFFVPIELTESATTADRQIKKLTVDLKENGFRIHMDDFGSGYSSLENLNLLPFDVVKLDKSLIDFIGDPGGDEIIRHVIELAHFKEMKIVAEGVENSDQLEFLRKLNCDAIQGFYFSKPKSSEDFWDFMEKQQRYKMGL